MTEMTWYATCHIVKQSFYKSVCTIAEENLRKTHHHGGSTAHNKRRKYTWHWQIKRSVSSSPR